MSFIVESFLYYYIARKIIFFIINFYRTNGWKRIETQEIEKKIECRSLFKKNILLQKNSIQTNRYDTKNPVVWG